MHSVHIQPNSSKSQTMNTLSPQNKIFMSHAFHPYTTKWVKTPNNEQKKKSKKIHIDLNKLDIFSFGYYLRSESQNHFLTIKFKTPTTSCRMCDATLEQVSKNESTSHYKNIKFMTMQKTFGLDCNHISYSPWLVLHAHN